MVTLVFIFCSFFLSLSSSSQMAPPSWTVSQGWAQGEEVVEEQRGSTPRIRAPRNASMSPTFPSASETLTYGKCSGCVEQSRPAVFICHFVKRCFWEKKTTHVSTLTCRSKLFKMWCSERKAEPLCFRLLFSSAATMWPNISPYLWRLSPPHHPLLCFSPHFQQFGKILDVEIIFNERGSKVEKRKHEISQACQ